MAEQFKHSLLLFSFRTKEYLYKMANSKFLQSLRSRLPKALFHTIVLYSYYHILTEYFYDIAKCEGFSMEPTLYSNDVILIRKMDRYSVKKGDIVVLRNPECPTKYLCKRVVHTSGDVIFSPKFSGKIPRGSIWLEGDNLLRSTDSRHYGPVPKGLILGKAMYVIWPMMKDLQVY